MWRAAFVGLVATLCVSDPALAQAGRITGTVTSTDGAKPVVGAQLIVAGTMLGALTRDDGRYTITVPPGTYTVRAIRLGFRPDSVTGIVVGPNATTTTNFTLQSSASVLSSVLVIGYGTQQERDRTGAVETVSAKEFNTGRVVSPEQLIQAKVPGVQIVDNNEPGGGIVVRIRGGTSVTSSNDPLYVVDGVPIAVGGGISAGRNPLNFLNPADIDNVTVLKDASATAIYGSRGANGVILITTKTGTRGTQVTYNGSYSNSVVARTPDLLNTAQFRAAVAQFAPENVNKLGSASTDWMKAVERSATGQEHDLAAAGARQDMRYRLSLGYLDQDGALLGTNTKRVSGALNYSDQLLGNRLDVHANIRGSRTDDVFSPGDMVGAATAFAPTQPIRSAPGTFFEWSNPLSPNNPLSELALASDQGTTYRSVGNVETKYRAPFLEGLSGTVRGGYDVGSGDRTYFAPSTARPQIVNSLGGTFSRDTPAQTNVVLDAFGNYARGLSRVQSNIDLTAGYSYERFRSDFTHAFAQGLSTDLLGPNGIPASKLQQNTVDVQESKLISGFARANYTLRDKYLFTLSVRRDGSSRFGPGNQWGVFPSAAVAWRIVDEPFMKPFGAISDLKLRYSYGVNGNQAFPNYLAYSTYLVGNSLAQAQFGNTFVTTIRPSAVDPNIRWEQTKSSNVGLDYGLFNNRLTGVVEYYTKKTTDLIFNVPVAAGTNLSNFVTTNIGSLQNSGLELGVNARVIDGRYGGLTWDAGFNAATNANKLLRITTGGGGTDQILTGGIAGGVGSTIEVLQPGHPINSFFVYRHKNGPDGKPVTGNKTDLELYQDINGDGVINQSDRVAYKSPAPKWILGHSSQLGYSDFDMSFTLRAYLGNYVYNNVASNFGNYSAVKGATPNNLQASVLKYGFVKPQYFSDLYIEDGSFLRMDNITLGYTFRRLRSFGQLRAFGTVQNVFTKTKYTGVDPVAAFAGAFGNLGIDNNLFPLTRTFSTGIAIGF